MDYVTVTLDYVIWWYSGGLKRLFSWLAAVYGWAVNFLSIKTILLTLFSPWKKVVGAKRPGLEGFRDWVVDNLISRGVGFAMRLLVLFSFLIFSVLFSGFSIFITFFWVCFPVIFIYSIIGIFA